jgi:lipid-A-disaccharide synthase
VNKPIEISNTSIQSNILFYIAAGEASGDILGARLMLELTKRFPNAVFKGIGGPLMIEQGLQSFYPMERLSVMGVAPILARLPELLKMRKRFCKTIVDEKTDCFIGIDAPVFNTQLEFNLKQQGVTTVHYVSPSVWAWRENRIHKIVKSVSLMVCLFPFELEIYRQHGLPAVCVGHPLANELPLICNQANARKELLLATKGKILAILPGSRGSEMNFLLGPFLGAAIGLCKRYPDLKVVIPCANNRRRIQLEKYLESSNIQLKIEIFDGQSREVMAAADVILLASGTATLEAMLLKKPMVVGYKVSSLSYWIYSKLLKIKNFSLPNLLARKQLVKELMQNDCTEENILSELVSLFEQDENSDLQKEYLQLHNDLQLGGSKKAAESIANLLLEKDHDK